jgi:hypothetical protein
MQAAVDTDAAGFCIASMLVHVPHKTVREAAAIGSRVRDLGSAGFPDIEAGSGKTEGWVDFKHRIQSYNGHLWRRH